MFTVIPYVCIFALVLSAMVEVYGLISVVFQVANAIKKGYGAEYKLFTVNTLYLAFIIPATVYFWS